MAELDDDDVASGDQVGKLGEAAFVGVGAGGTAGDGFVDDGDAVEERGKVFTPSCIKGGEVIRTLSVFRKIGKGGKRIGLGG